MNPAASPNKNMLSFPVFMSFSLFVLVIRHASLFILVALVINDEPVSNDFLFL